MKNIELVDFKEALNNVAYVDGKDFASAVYENMIIIENELEKLSKMKKEPHSDYINYENERILLCETSSKKDENGKVKFEYDENGQQRYDIEDFDKFNVKFEELKNKYDAVLMDMQKAKNDMDILLNQEVSVEFFKVGVAELPEKINAATMKTIKYMLK